VLLIYNEELPSRRIAVRYTQLDVSQYIHREVLYATIYQRVVRGPVPAHKF